MGIRKSHTVEGIAVQSAAPKSENLLDVTNIPDPEVPDAELAALIADVRARPWPFVGFGEADVILQTNMGASTRTFATMPGQEGTAAWKRAFIAHWKDELRARLKR